jgi:hypothetical protein
LYEDRRLGGVTKWVYGSPGDLMRIPEEILDTVGFLVGKDAVEEHVGGTAFFLSIPSRTLRDLSHPYLITAKHCITKAKREKFDLYLRLNTKEGKWEDIQLNDGWTYPEDPSIDLAMMRFCPGPRYWYRALTGPMLANEEQLRGLKVGIGDDVVISGLFTKRKGREKNLPIVRFGNIAAMPSEAIPDSETGLSFHAYLIEARSIGGLSGSPVFLYIGPDRRVPGEPIPQLDQCQLFLIGVIRGHWKHDDMCPPPSAYIDDLTEVNYGIATVTPAIHLLPLLYSEDAVKERNQLDMPELMRDAPTSDFVAKPKKKNEEAFTKDDFEAALKKSSRKVEPK